MKNERKEWSVYIHTNKINHRAYIGVAVNNPQNRWGKDGSGYLKKENGKYTQPAIANAIEAYGWDNFDHNIFMDGLTQKEAHHIEKLLISMFYTNCMKYYDPPFGYNLTDGGDTPPCKQTGVYQYDLSGNYIQRWNSIIDVVNTLGIRSCTIVLCCQGLKKSAGGFMWSYYKFDKISSYKNKREKIVVLQYDKFGNFINKFGSLSEASKATNISVSSICNCCKHNIKSAGGYIWRVEGDDDIFYINNQGNNRKPVLQFTIDGVFIRRFESIKEACEHIGKKSRRSIKQCCNHERKEAYGYKWEWDE